MDSQHDLDCCSIEFIRAVINAFPQNVCVLLKDRKHNWILANHSAASTSGFGDSLGAVGKSDDDTWATPTQIENFKASDLRVFAGEDIVNVVEAQSRADGLHYLEGSKRLIQFGDNEYLLACWIDVTALVAARDEARRRRDMMALELDVVTHDAASALRAIKNMPYLLRESLLARGIELNADELRFIERINSNVDRVQKLNKALAQARGFEDQKLDCIPISTLFEECKMQFPDKPIEWVFTDDFEVMTNREIFSIALMGNLISNGLKYGESGRPVTVRAAREGDNAFFYVHNFGPHVGAEYAEKIFILGNGSRLNPSIEGTGVGLFQARRAVQSMGGKIWLVPTKTDFEIAFTLKAGECGRPNQN
jgi:signal transduction histidine kinase